jgi:hypothetical protein
MQTPVRYYITRDDDRPVVRSIPVSMRPEPKKLEQHIPVESEEHRAQPEAAVTPGRMKSLVRNAVRRPARTD